MGAGRPTKYTVEEFASLVDKYFTDFPDTPTLAGLAYALDMDRQTLYNYRDRDEFFDIVKKARNYIESRYETRLIYDGSPTGVIFALKNMGWSDKQEVEQSTTLKDQRIDESKLSDEELRLLADLQRKSSISPTPL